MSDPASFPENPSRIILTGFMGAGKTTVGALVAQRLGWTFVDSDHVVEERAGMTVAQIFEGRGEAAFRELEAAAVRDAGSKDRVVLALGGGALEMPGTREYLAAMPDALVIFLEAPLATMIARCAEHDNGPVRPVLADQARLNERWSQRLPWYRKAHLTVQTGRLSPEAVVDCIMERLKPRSEADHPLATSSANQAASKRGVLA
jgi:shikimate kinase